MIRLLFCFPKKQEKDGSCAEEVRSLLLSFFWVFLSTMKRDRYKREPNPKTQKSKGRGDGAGGGYDVKKANRRRLLSPLSPLAT